MTTADLIWWCSPAKEPVINELADRFLALGLGKKQAAEACWRAMEGCVIILNNRPGNYISWGYYQPQQSAKCLLNLL